MRMPLKTKIQSLKVFPSRSTYWLNTYFIKEDTKMAEFASKGVAGSGLGLGIAGTALGLLNGNNGLLGGLLGNGCACHENMPVNRYELGQESKIAELQSQIALRDANTYNDQKLLEVYKYFDGELKELRQMQCDKWAAQGVINAKFESAIDVMGSQVASINTTIANITRTVIPNASVCPGWGAVTVQSTGCSCNNGYNANI